MSICYHEEPPNSSNRCKFLASTLKDAFCNCHTIHRTLSTSSPEEDHPTSDFEDEQEVVVSVIRSRAMEAKLRRKAGFMSDSFSWVFSQETGDLIITSKALQKEKDNEDVDEGREEFLSVGSCFSCCSSAASKEAFFSMRTNFSRCSSLNGLDLPFFWRRSVIQEFCHCEGWPFGLCRKAVLLPPLPKSPSESWSWRKGSRCIKVP